LAPEYAKAAQVLESSDLNVKLAKVDTTVHKNLGERFGIRGFPTLKFFQDEKNVEFTGGRTEAAIVQWLEKKMGAQSVLIESAEAIEQMKQKAVTVVYFGAENEDFQTFLKLASAFEEISFAHSFDDALRTSMEASKVTLFKNFDEGRNIFEGEMTLENLENFVEVNSIKTIMEFDQKAAEVIFSNAKDALFALYSQDNEESKTLTKTLEDASKQLKGKVVMSTSNVSEGLGSRLGEFLGYAANQEPNYMMITFEDDDVKKFFYSGSVSVENLVQFVNDVQNGTAKPFLKSEEIPEDNSAPVKIVVGKNFDAIVMDDTKDVLVEFYAPWCGHCKQLEPKYEELAKSLSSNKNIVIAKVDATANEIPGVGVRSFPTIKMWARGKKSDPIDYNGDREVEGFMKFLKENTDFEETDMNQDL